MEANQIGSGIPRSRILQIDIVPYGSAKGGILGVGIPGKQRVFRRHASFIIRPFFSLSELWDVAW